MRKNILTMTVNFDLPIDCVEKHIGKFMDRLIAKMEGRLHAKEDTFTLAYYLIRKMQMKLGSAERDRKRGGPVEVTHDISYVGAAALAYELKTYPARPRTGVLVQILGQLDQGLREKKQHDRERKRTAKRRDRPTVRESRRLHSPGAGGSSILQNLQEETSASLRAQLHPRT